jgi:Fur family ferric uptake transcriptional regulator
LGYYCDWLQQSPKWMMVAQGHWLDEATTDQVTEQLRDRGHRITPQRRLVLEAVAAADQHISAEEIYAQVHSRYPLVNKSTIYRSLKLLKELDLVTETDLGDGRVRYHFGAKGHHHHLVCLKCGTVTELDQALLTPLEVALRENYHFRPQLNHLAIFGYCAQCDH